MIIDKRDPPFLEKPSDRPQEEHIVQFASFKRIKANEKVYRVRPHMGLEVTTSANPHWQPFSGIPSLGFSQGRNVRLPVDDRSLKGAKFRQL
jgi:hypothetical protein